MRTSLLLASLCLFGLINSCFSVQLDQPMVVTMTDDGQGESLAPQFWGLSYESSMLLQKSGRYFFDARDSALVNTFKTLGIKNLQVGANVVDDLRISDGSG
jgi:hypothetical protein